ncbi:MAG: hypothetical protein FJZ16_09555 [Candidatus Omnitrophica bacterium]|nr:hypothetical protein [Candidatus Omnitrophota bacterium]
MLLRLLETSIIFTKIKFIFNSYLLIEELINRIYKESLMHYIIKKLLKRIKLFFKYSFFSKITEIKEQKIYAFFDNSKSINFMLTAWFLFKHNLFKYLDLSISLSVVKKIQNKVYLFPVKTASIVIILMIIVNISVALLFENKIGPFEWFAQGMFLFISLDSLSSNTRWEELKETSFILRKIGLVD